ncbi:hypothetical protein [Mycobacterium intracellulare]|uniref:hypothetical protein n=1 Tax=Mycobacterium intracellulare TaxID=1767 RepID=UPI001EED29F1|nr:hypothetical protein [Mycobacterium intracellulare]MEE3755334.1 hypothetical protein [Mycobacterium intracellulare]
MPEGTGPHTYIAAAAALTMLAANFEIQQGVLLAHEGGMDALWPGSTVAARQGKIAAYSAWLQSMVAECERLSAAYVVAAGLDTTPLQSIPDLINRAVAMMPVNVRAYLDTTYMLRWQHSAARLSGAQAQRITSTPLLVLPPPPLVDGPAYARWDVEAVCRD